jgi:hypothetical protein
VPPQQLSRRGSRDFVPIPRALVVCSKCGRIEYVSSEDLVGYMQIGWPQCCAGVMTYYLETEWPEANDATTADASDF